MKINSTPLNKLGGLLGATAIRAWMQTLDYRAAYYEPSIDPAHPDWDGNNKIFVFWHEYILFPIHLRGNCNLAMLLSRHRDAEVLSYAAGHLGFEFVRGSTSRGGAAALADMMRRGRRMNLVITPDGPRGPRRILAKGPVFLASTLGLPIVAMGLGYDSPWRLSSWDRFAIPRPGSRARSILSPPMHIPRGLDRDGIEHYRVETERMLNWLTGEAEQWAKAGTRKPDEQRLFRKGAVGRRQPTFKPLGIRRAA